MRNRWHPIIVFILFACLAYVQNARCQPDTVQPTTLDCQLIKVQRNSEQADQMVPYVMQGLALLPDAVKKNLIDKGVTIAVVGSRKGGACYDIQSKRVVIPAWNETTNSAVDKQRISSITLLHELGHAYDHANGRPSFSATFYSLYDAEVKLVPATKRKMLAYFLEGETAPGASPHRPPQECFASLFASRYVRQNFPRLKTLKECFPRCAAFVAELRP